MTNRDDDAGRSMGLAERALRDIQQQEDERVFGAILSQGFWECARKSTVGVVVTAFPTRDTKWRARVEADGRGFYTPDHGSLSELFAKLAEDARAET